MSKAKTVEFEGFQFEERPIEEGESNRWAVYVRQGVEVLVFTGQNCPTVKACKAFVKGAKNGQR